MLQHRIQGSKLIFRSGASWRLTEKFWSPVRKFWLSTYFIYNLHTKNTILYVTLHARKVTIEERKQLATTRVTRSVVSQVMSGDMSLVRS